MSDDDPANFITKCYQHILNRDPDPAGLDFYLKKLNSGEISREQLLLIFKESEEYKELQFVQKVFKKYSSKIKNPIFIIGVQRSGTTLLYSILCRHDSVAWVSDQDMENWMTPQEQFFYESFYSFLKIKNRKIPVTEPALYVFGKELGNGLKHFGIQPPNSSKIPIEGELLWQKFFGTGYVTDIPIYKKIKYVKAINQILENQSKSRFLCKAPQNNPRLFAIHEIFPDAKFVNIIRDPRAVVSSILQRYEDEGFPEFIGTTSEMIRYEEMTKIEKIAYEYRQNTEYIYKFRQKYPESIINIFYENLIMDPEKELKNILDFCSLQHPANLTDWIPHIETKNNEKWKNKISRIDEKTIFQINSDVIKKMGYPYSHAKRADTISG